MESFASIRTCDEEVHTSPTYSLDNTCRDRAVWEVITVQRTLHGAGFFRDAGGERRVPAGFAMLFTHHEPTAYGYPKDATEPYRLRYLQVLPAATIKPVFDELRGDFGSVALMVDGSEATALFNEMYTRYHQRTFRDRFHESELVYRFFVALYREQVQETKTTDPIEFGYHYLRNHFRSPINLKMIADKCRVSREHFIREFSKRFDEPPGSMLRRLRIENAHAMLEATRQTVEDVALASGFTSTNSFGRAYRQRYGHSPRAQPGS